MADESLNTAILKEIRDELRGLRASFNDRLDETNARLDRTNERLDQTIQNQIRMQTTLSSMREVQDEHSELLGKVVRSVNDINARLDNVILGPMGSQVRDHEERIKKLESRVGRNPRRQ